MKKLLLFLLLTVSISTIGQSKYSYKRGLKFISKVEKFYQKNEFEKSLYYLNKYENSVLGHCGSAVIFAKRDIYNIKIKNYAGLKNYDDVLTLIDKNDPIFSEEFQKDDSLKVEILFLKCGKENVIKAFKNCRNITAIQDMYFYTYSLKLEDLNYIFKLRKVENTETELEYNSSQYEINKLLKDSSIFNLIF